MSSAASPRTVTLWGRGPREWLTCHSLGLALIAGVLAILGLAYPAMSYLASSRSLKVVVAARDIPAYSLLTAPDLRLATVDSRGTDVIRDVATAAGRTETDAVRCDSPLRLSTTAAVAHDWLLLSVPYTSTVPLVTGSQVLVLGVMKYSDMATTVSDTAIVLQVQAQQAVIALPRSQVLAAATYLAPSGRLILVRRPS